MLKLEGLLGVAVLGLYIFCVIDVIGTPEKRVRSLPKLAWVFIVLLFPLAGSIAWLAVGRPEPGAGPAPAPRRAASAFPEYDRPGRFAAANPDDDEEFLRRVRERADEQRRRHRESRADPAGPDEPPAGPAEDEGV